MSQDIFLQYLNSTSPETLGAAAISGALISVGSIGSFAALRAHQKRSDINRVIDTEEVENILNGDTYVNMSWEQKRDGPKVTTDHPSNEDTLSQYKNFLEISNDPSKYLRVDASTEPVKRFRIEAEDDNQVYCIAGNTMEGLRHRGDELNFTSELRNEIDYFLN